MLSDDAGRLKGREIDRVSKRERERHREREREQEGEERDRDRGGDRLREIVC